MNNFYDCYDLSKKVYIFGDRRFAEMLAYLLEFDSPFSVGGFIVDKVHISSSTAFGKPVIAFEEIDKILSPNDVYLLFPISFQNINNLRKSRFENAKKKGFSFIGYASSKAIIWPHFKLLENTIIYENAVIQPFATVGFNTTIRSSVHISHHSHIKNHCFIAAGVVTGGNVVIENQSFCGLNATIKDSIRLASKTFVGAGSVLLNSTDENSIYVGNPAKRLNKKADEI